MNVKCMAREIFLHRELKDLKRKGARKNTLRYYKNLTNSYSIGQAISILKKLSIGMPYLTPQLRIKPKTKLNN